MLRFEQNLHAGANVQTRQRDTLIILLLTHVGLFALFSLMALGVADSFKVPDIMLGYVFPYRLAARGLGPDTLPFVFFLQAAVVLSVVGAAIYRQVTRTWPGVIAIGLAVLWFLASILITLAAYVH